MPRAVAALVLLLLVLPAASAQGTGISVGLTPDRVEIVEGANASFEVTVSNALNRSVVVRLAALNVSAGTNVTFASNDLLLTPGQAGAVVASVTSRDVGTHEIAIRASQLNGTATATRTLTLVVSANATQGNATEGNATTGSNTTTTGDQTRPDNSSRVNFTELDDPAANATQQEEQQQQQPPPPDLLLPEPFDVEPASFSAGVATNASTLAEFRLANGAGAQTFTARLELPAGWEGSVTPEAGSVPEGGAVTLRATLRPTFSAVSGEGRLVVSGAAGEVVVPLDLAHVRAPRGVRVVVLPPTEVAGAPGDTVLLFVRASNDDDATRAATLVVDAATAPVDPAQRDLTLAAHAERTEAFQALIPSDAAVGSTLRGVVRVDGAEAATFTILVRAPAAVAPPAIEAGGAGALAAMAVGVGLASVGAMLYSRHARGIGLFLLYARLAPRRALEHPRRRDMVDLVRARPGLTISEVQRELGLSNGTARHHVALLQVAGVLRCVQDGKLRRLWPHEAGRVEAVAALAERIVATLATNGPTRASELAATLGVTRQAVHYHLGRLEREGRIVVRRGEGEVLLEAARHSIG